MISGMQGWAPGDKIQPNHLRPTWLPFPTIASKMLAKTMRAKVPSEYRPIATIRLFYKLFAYMI